MLFKATQIAGKRVDELFTILLKTRRPKLTFSSKNISERVSVAIHGIMGFRSIPKWSNQKCEQNQDTPRSKCLNIEYLYTKLNIYKKLKQTTWLFKNVIQSFSESCLIRKDILLLS